MRAHPPPAPSDHSSAVATIYTVSRAFYGVLGFTEAQLGPAMCVLQWGEGVAFYLQNAYVEEWVDNTMLFLEVDDLDAWHAQLTCLDLPGRFEGVRLSGINVEEWGRECFLHDPSGVLWHIGSFASSQQRAAL